MFSGIIEVKSKIHRIKKMAKSMQLTIESPWNDVEIGESIAIDGVCLSVTKAKDAFFDCDLSAETLAVSKAKFYQVGAFVNLERSLRLNQRIWGHITTGHVDAVLKVKAIKSIDDCREIILSGVLSEHSSYLIKKGSVALEGVSLTINDVFTDGFQVMIIPETLKSTTLKEVKVGDFLNVEYDQVVKIISRQVHSMKGQLL